jgi:hypothetical protein
MVKYLVVLIVIVSASMTLVYDLRADLPYPGNYITRLLWLDGWSTKGSIGLNCSGYLTNASGAGFMEADEMYAGGHRQLEIIAELPDRFAIDETQLQTGDIAAFRGSGTFHGHPLEGVHVAAFVREGVWIDSDARRGNVSEFDLEDKPTDDPWFEGKVRILRWVKPHRSTSPILTTLTSLLIKLSYARP